MCGIAGFYGFRDDKLIKKISKELQHRGPDGEGIFTNDKVTLLNRRLAIIDLKTGDQPKFSKDKKIALVFNGEIYNYRELREELLAKNHKFSTQSDTEVIVKAYEEWGEECFDKLNGMFGLAIYDGRRKKLVLARDHFGIKPLYYSIIGTKLIFSSEISPILNSGLVKKVPNDRIIYRYLKYRVHDDQSETFFKGINKLMPGQMMIITGRKITVNSYTKLEQELRDLAKQQLTLDKVTEEFRARFMESVKLRLIADVPVGTCLSGGLDSSAIVAVINRLLKQHAKESQSVGKVQKTFSAVFPASSNNEEKYIDLLTKETGVKNFKVRPKSEGFFKDLELFVKIQEEPTISTGPYAQYKIMKEVSRHVKVVLDGQGSDEILAGYDPYHFVYLKQLLSEGKYFKLVVEFFTSWDINFKYVNQKIISAFGPKREIAPDKLLKNEFANRHANDKYSIKTENLKQRLIDDIFYDSLPSLLRYEDKNSMAFSIEGRVPFLDFNLLRYVFSLPDEYIIHNGWNKKVLRDAVNNLLPQSIAGRRNKIGFTTPELEWFKKLIPQFYAILLSESFAKRKYFNRQEVLRAFEVFVEGKNDDTMLFWRFINLEIWLRTFFDNPKEEKIKQVVPKIKVDGKEYLRKAIKTELFKKGDAFAKKIAKQLQISNLKENKNWFLVVSEKIVAVAQGRSYFLWELKPGFWAKNLSKYVKRTPVGIGLGSPWTMELAIREIGLARILFATFASVLTKPLGIEGIFYHIAGRQVAAIDGPTEYSLYPSNVSAKLAPKDPQKAAEQIHKEVAKNTGNNFLGVVIIDANDLGQNVLANTTSISSRLIEKIFTDNPMGQGKEQTPLTVVSF